jgi:trans-aconitate methyltransferase
MFRFKDIAEDYDKHVNDHIPNYLKVIQKTLSICSLYPYNSNIVDFGSANGQTLKTLSNLGYNNLHGVEPVQEMINISDPQVATYYKELPDIEFDIIIANWVLHFIQDKSNVLEKFYNSMNKSSTLILSEKVSTDLVIRKFYHNFKISNGLSKQQIENKERNLVGVMYLLSLKEYILLLNTIGFTTIEIIDGDWGFVTLMIKK